MIGGAFDHCGYTLNHKKPVFMDYSRYFVTILDRETKRLIIDSRERDVTR